MPIITLRLMLLSKIFPTSKEELISYVRAMGANRPVVQILIALPDREYHSIEDFMNIAKEGEKPG